MATATGRDNSNPEFARILQLLAEISSPRPDEPLAFLQWCRAAIESWRDDFADQPDHKLLQRALTILRRAAHELQKDGDKGIAHALDSVWCAAGAKAHQHLFFELAKSFIAAFARGDPPLFDVWRRRLWIPRSRKDVIPCSWNISA